MDKQQTLELLTNGEMRLEGRLAWGSNYTLLGYVCADEVEMPMVYKPRRGERPLWDFPRGTLCLRERAAYIVSEAAGWDIVPPTVLREGVHGYGSVQAFVEHDPDIHYFNIEGDLDFAASLQKIVVFDWITNNADRKAGHVLIGANDRLWAIDHGICFNTDYKLRSVIWEFAGGAFSAELHQSLKTLRQNLDTAPYADELMQLLDREEITILNRRLDQLIDVGIFPEPGPGRHYPWPPV
jgi:uncharacterized repeat protein (TIGR03843 family)